MTKQASFSPKPPTAQATDPVSAPATLARPAAVTELWLIRHAEVESAYQRVFGGRIDMNLSPEGHRQAETLAQYLRPFQFDAVYASPMKRVQQTLAPALPNGLPSPQFKPSLREVDFGDWTGLGWAQVEEEFGVSAYSWLDQLESNGIPNAESGAVLRARVEPCLREILAAHTDQTIAIACHGGVIRMLLSILMELPLPKLAAFEVDYASITRVLWEDQSAELELLNFTPWRDLNHES